MAKNDVINLDARIPISATVTIGEREQLREEAKANNRAFARFVGMILADHLAAKKRKVGKT